MRENVLQSLDLGSGLVADHDRLVPPGPDLVPPADPAPELAGEVGAQVAHEVGELAGVVDVQLQVKVVGGKGERAEADRVHPLGAGQDADDDVVELRAGAKEEAAVDRPAGDLDQGTAFGDVAESSAHA
jgi:hypothetical protein